MTTFQFLFLLAALVAAPHLTRQEGVRSGLILLGIGVLTAIAS